MKLGARGLALTICCLCTIIATVKPDSARLVAKLISLETMLAQGTQGTVQYPVDKTWIKDLNCYIQKNTRKFSEKISCNLFPRPITLSKTNDNDYVGEKTWNTLVELFGVSYQHDLSRQLSSSSDFNTYIMSAIDVVQSPQDLEHVGKFPINWAFHKEEKLGYVMNQLRHHFKIPRGRKTRLWFTTHWSINYSQQYYNQATVTATAATAAWLVTDLSQTVCMVRNSVRTQDTVKGIPNLLIRPDLTQRYPSPLYHEHEKPSCDPNGRGIATSLGQLTLEVATASHNSWPTNRYVDLVPVNPFPMPYRDRGYGLTFGNSNSNTTDVDLGYNDETSDDIENMSGSEIAHLNISQEVSRWTDALLSKISAEVKDEMSTVYNVAQAVGRQRCEHLEEREKYMEELESGLRTLQQHTDDLKARLQRLRQQEDDDLES